MSCKLIDGKKIAEEVKNEIAKEIFKLNGLRPNLAIIIVGEKEDSNLYVSLKEKQAKSVGIDTHLYKLDKETSEIELLDIINFLNKDDLIDGILVQLPLPDKFKTNDIISTINPLKDVDGFHLQRPDYLVSPVLAAVQASLDEIKNNFIGKSACLFYNSDVFGRSLKELILKNGYQVLDNKNSDQADLIVSALGEPGVIKKEMVKEEAAIIDIGITKIKDKVFGDANFNDLKDKISYLTPVPGGIGPMTIAFLFKNVLAAFKAKHKIS